MSKDVHSHISGCAQKNKAKRTEKIGADANKILDANFSYFAEELKLMDSVLTMHIKHLTVPPHVSL